MPVCIVAIWLSRFESTLIDDVVPVVGDRDESRKENNISLKDRGLVIGSLLDGLSLDMTMTRESSSAGSEWRLYYTRAYYTV